MIGWFKTEYTHVIDSYPISRYNGIKCRIEKEVQWLTYLSKNIVTIELEKKVDQWRGNKSKWITIDKKYLKSIKESQNAH